MKSVKLIILIVLVAAVSLTLIVLPGCKSTEEAAEEVVEEAIPEEETAEETEEEAVPAEEMEKPLIANVWLGMGAPYCPPYKETFEAGCEENGWDLAFFDAEFDPALQANQMDEAISMNPDLIILCALDASGMAAGIKKAFDAGIPVLADHTPVNPEDEQYTIGYTGPDNYTEGLIAGEMLDEALGGEGNIVIITGAAGQEAAISRPQGVRDTFAELGSNIEILAEQTADWDKAKATAVMADYITRYGDELDGVFGADDTLAVGAFIALEEAGYSKGDLVIVGIGGSKEGLAAIDDGIIFGTVLQSPVAGAIKAIETIKMALDQNIQVPDQLDPYLNYMPLPKITAENVADYLPGEW